MGEQEIKSKKTMSEEERAIKREMALRMNNEIVDPITGRRKFGGPQPGSGRPKKLRASEIVADRARTHARDLVQVFIDAIQPNNSINTRVQAAKAWIELEQKEAALNLEEEEKHDGMTDEDLISNIAGAMIRLQEAGNLEEVLEGAKEKAFIPENELFPLIDTEADKDVIDETDEYDN